MSEAEKNYLKAIFALQSEFGKGDSANLIAKKVIRKHRLLETFLVNTLGFNGHEVHDIAEQLEHVKSVKLIDKLDTFLDYPKYDPHGDFIPDKKGNLPQSDNRFLSKIPQNESYILKGVKDSSDIFLDYLNQKNIHLGCTIKIESKESFDNSMQIKVNDTILTIWQNISNNLIMMTKDNISD